MLLSSDYNSLAWWLIKEYGLSRKWAMKIAYCLRKIDIEPELLRYKPGSPLLPIWDPSNVMKVVCIMRSQTRECPDKERSGSLSVFCDLVYSKYRALGGIGAVLISKFGGGEVLYWATRLYVESLTAKEKSTSKYVILDLPEGESVSNTWFNH
jgi:hypothetical protein